MCNAGRVWKLRPYACWRHHRILLAETDLHSLLGGQGRAEPDILATGLDSVDEAVLPADATLPSGVLSI